MGVLKESSPVVHKLWHEFPKLSIMFQPNPYAALNYQVVLPEQLVPTVLKALHGEGFIGHLGAESTLQKARKICYWPYMFRDIYISTVVNVCPAKNRVLPLHMRKHLCSPYSQTDRFRKLQQISLSCQ